MTSKENVKIAIIDFGGQYTHLIARRIRKLGIYSEIYQPENFHLNKEPNVVGIIFSGGPKSITDNQYKIQFDIRELKVPLLGICYGHQLISALLGGRVLRGKSREYGLTTIHCETKSALFNGLSQEQKVWMSHYDYIEALPEGFRITASSNLTKIVAYESQDRKIFGMQFHPEVTHTINGMAMLNKFISICTNIRPWNSEDYKDVIIDKIRKGVGNKKVFLFLSGGVDSTVSLMLCIKAIGNENVFPIYIDTGFMRENETFEIKNRFEKLGVKNLKIINAGKLFLQKLKWIVNPEQKRKIIGQLFIKILNKELLKMKTSNNWMLVQGTIYPDTIESGDSKNSTNIKTHHNRVFEIEKLIKQGKVIEPLKELYKDEVRELGKSLGLPEELLQRHPFPGPGLAIRIIASDTDKPETSYNQDEHYLNDILKPYKFQAMILPIKSVGVQGDTRTYNHPALIWSNEHRKPNWDTLRECANKIVNQLNSVNRVLFSLEKLNGELRLRRCYLNKKQIDLLRKVDAIVWKYVYSIKEIWQMPVVSIPLFDDKGRQVFVIRPVCSKDGMTADFYQMDFALLEKIIEELKTIRELGNLCYDITTKPPGTIEWE